jgi:amino-acid N-acetyltransferase
MSDRCDVRSRTATAANAPSIRDRLQRSDLPTSDLGTARPDVVIAERAGELIGIAALERCGTAALLRSVAVEPQWRGCGVGRLIVAELEQRARAAGIAELIPLTLTARDFFARLGYGSKPREEVPAAVLGRAEFRSPCPASAHCMAKTLAPT